MGSSTERFCTLRLLRSMMTCLLIFQRAKNPNFFLLILSSSFLYVFLCLAWLCCASSKLSEEKPFFHTRPDVIVNKLLAVAKVAWFCVLRLFALNSHCSSWSFIGTRRYLHWLSGIEVVSSFLVFHGVSFDSQFSLGNGVFRFHSTLAILMFPITNTCHISYMFSLGILYLTLLDADTTTTVVALSLLPINTAVAYTCLQFDITSHRPL